MTCCFALVAALLQLIIVETVTVLTLDLWSALMPSAITSHCHMS